MHKKSHQKPFIRIASQDRRHCWVGNKVNHGTHKVRKADILERPSQFQICSREARKCCGGKDRNTPQYCHLGKGDSIQWVAQGKKGQQLRITKKNCTTNTKL